MLSSIRSRGERIRPPFHRHTLIYFTLKLSGRLLVTPPPVAVTVSVDVFTAAVDAAFNVSELLPPPGDAILVGENVAVTPLGNPLTDKLTADLNPLSTLVDTVTGSDPFRFRDTVVPPSVSVKSGPTTVRLIDCVLVTPPPEALTVSENTPATRPAAAVSVSVLPPVPGDAMLLGTNLAVTPLGRPLAESVMTDLNSFTAVVFSVTGVELPAVTVAAETFDVSVNVGTCTVRVNG
jgi:hypothetical protein